MKRIITCSDGTWDKPGNTDHGKVVRSNVQKIFQVISKSDDGINQLKHYDDGVGATGTIWKKVIDGATGGGLDANIIDAYKFIVWNYEPGDKIYLFGFSRGAYTARSLAGLIRNCGILKNQDLCLIQKAYDFYRDRSDETKPGSAKSAEFISENSYPNPEIEFIGVWDTVGALGIPLTIFQLWNRKKYRFHDLELSSIIKHAYQAMAIDERRKLFDVNLWKRSAHAKDENIQQFVEQRWFAGVHCDIGGGYIEEQLSDLTLEWMIEKAKFAKLAIDMTMAVTNADFPVFVSPSFNGEKHNSRIGIYLLSPAIVRKIGQLQGYNECIDVSVINRMEILQNDYKPVNVEDGIKRKVPICIVADHYIDSI